MYLKCRIRVTEGLSPLVRSPNGPNRPVFCQSLPCIGMKWVQLWVIHTGSPMSLVHAQVPKEAACVCDLGHSGWSMPQ